jgi:hypothetical protein
METGVEAWRYEELHSGVLAPGKLFDKRALLGMTRSAREQCALPKVVGRLWLEACLVGYIH